MFRRRIWIWLLVGICGVESYRTARAQDDALRRSALSAIERAQQYLESQQLSDGSWTYPGHEVGATALITMSLIYSGRTPQHESVRRGLEYLRLTDVPRNVYDVSLAIQALALGGDTRSQGRLRTLAQWLVEAQQVENDAAPGAWGYGQRTGGSWDNSNTQFAILGLREAVHAGVEVPREVWERSQRHFLTRKHGSAEAGGSVSFYYHDGYSNAKGSMQVAGIASLMITQAMLDDDRNVRPGGEIDCCSPTNDEVHRTVEAAFRWLGTPGNFSVTSNPASPDYYLYYLYGLERAGRFTGRRFIGPADQPYDWYRLGVRHLVEIQNSQIGGWFDANTASQPTIGTALALIFLSKGNSPVLINKLRYGDPKGELYGRGWNRQPRDAANLTDFVSTLKRWPKLLSWQTVDLGVAAREQDGTALLQARVQLLTGDGPLDAITDREVDLLREYISQGGFLFAVNTCGSNEFEQGFKGLVQRMFPAGDQQLHKLADTHDVYRSEYVLNPANAGTALELWGVDLGCRTAIMYAPYDHACRWNKWMHIDPPRRELNVRTQIKRSMDLGVNVIAYATGRELQDALTEPPQLAAVDSAGARGRLEIARLKHTGGWDTAPSALRHLQLALANVGIDTAATAPNLAATEPNLPDYPLLYMHGRKNFRLSPAEQAGLKTYLTQGGFLFADACCGEKQFDASFRALIRELYNRDLEAIPLDHPLFHPELGHDIRTVRRRLPRDTVANAPLEAEYQQGPPVLEGITDEQGRYLIVYSKYDLSCALERQATVNCAGYASEDAARIATNIVVYALTQ